MRENEKKLITKINNKINNQPNKELKNLMKNILNYETSVDIDSNRTWKESYNSIINDAMSSSKD